MWSFWASDWLRKIRSRSAPKKSTNFLTFNSISTSDSSDVLKTRAPICNEPLVGLYNMKPGWGFTRRKPISCSADLAISVSQMTGSWLWIPRGRGQTRELPKVSIINHQAFNHILEKSSNIQFMFNFVHCLPWLVTSAEIVLEQKFG